MLPVIRFAAIPQENHNLVFRGIPDNSAGSCLQLYFSQGFTPLLFDFTDAPSINEIDFEVFSRNEGVLFQLALSGPYEQKPVRAILNEDGKEPVIGMISQGLFNGFWRFHFPGPISAGGFRLQIRFA